jgi:hypothetical protein
MIGIYGIKNKITKRRGLRNIGVHFSEERKEKAITGAFRGHKEKKLACLKGEKNNGRLSWV